MTTTILPLWPHILFAILEPLSLIGGWLLPILDLNSFITDQIPQLVATHSTIHPTSVALAYQLANLYGLLCILGLAIVYSTTEPIVLRNYFIALAVADVGHIYVTYLAMGWATFKDVGAWNVLTWGNVGVTTFLLMNRILYLGGVFGVARASSAPSIWVDHSKASVAVKKRA
ncbi:hypothetical protein FE257_006875 [Aspergillus nanangensis]|uniref:DUF7704 domain-containing protein n=1 Tax=Aspergillus nanangensis TaxID=2582783 RepID=A0AAD4CNJ6_ASPNN|nr:hypothetical protein FE257_006875 [Aspergillus nanangensis]